MFNINKLWTNSSLWSHTADLLLLQLHKEELQPARSKQAGSEQPLHFNIETEEKQWMRFESEANWLDKQLII